MTSRRRLDFGGSGSPPSPPWGRLPPSTGRLPPSTPSRRIQDDLEAPEPPPSLILPRLYLGSLRNRQNTPELHHLGITHIVSLLSTISEDTSSQPFVVLHVAVKDTYDSTLIQCEVGPILEFILHALATGGTVLVHCRAGVSRSASVMVAYYMLIRPSATLEESLEYVRLRRPCICPNDGFRLHLQSLHIRWAELRLGGSSKSPESNPLEHTIFADTCVVPYDHCCV